MTKKMTKREIESQAKKKKIFEVSMELFKKYGFDKTTMSDISRETGFSNGSIYHFYTNKQSILIQLVLEIYEDAQKYLSLTDERLEHPKESIKKYYTKLIELHDQYSVDIIRNMAEACSEEYRLGMSRKYMDFSLFLIRDFLKAVQNKSKLVFSEDPEKLGEMLHLLYMGCLFTWIYYPISTTLVEVFERNFNFLFNELLAKME
ncbi:TetR/AcrR family transcriptional regulator [Eubacteriaceae bacterium ES2]|nr:TetR/AcrR family transcriptional regulator [Eubacteriaceae bacterium ES2]